MSPTSKKKNTNDERSPQTTLDSEQNKTEISKQKSACCTSLRTWVQVPAPPKILGFVAQVPVTTAW